jgi:hypothetical protein
MRDCERIERRTQAYAMQVVDLLGYQHDNGLQKVESGPSISSELPRISLRSSAGCGTIARAGRQVRP